MMFKIGALLLSLAQSSSEAMGSSPKVMGNEPDAPRPGGIYAAFAAGLTSFDIKGAAGASGTSMGSAFEGRLGYAFPQPVELYLSVSRDATEASVYPATISVWELAACVQFHFFVRDKVMFYLHGGLGFGISDNLLGPRSSEVDAGLAEVLGLGLELRPAPQLSFALEPFYRHAALANGGLDATLSVLGVQLLIAYY